MIKLTITNLDNYLYTLKDEKGNVYNLKIEFHNLKNKPNIGNTIYINEQLLKNMNNQITSFGPLNGIYGKNIKSANDKDLLILDNNTEEIYLKRYYG